MLDTYKKCRNSSESGFRFLRYFPSIIAAFCCLPVLPTFAAPMTLPAGVPALPALNAFDKPGVIISIENSASFAPLVPPEVLALVKSGELQFEAAVTIPSLELLDLRWSASSGKAPLTSIAGDEWKRELFPPSGFLFPRDSYNDNSQPLGPKLLWNALSHLWSLRNTRADFSLFLLKEKNRARKLKFSVERIYPESLGTGKLPQIFREKVALTFPAPLAGLTWLTFRFLGDEEDAVWVLSPAISRLRELTGTNRSDDIFKGSFAVDDIWVSSGKIENSDVRSVSRETRFVPFLKSAPRRLIQKDEGNCSATAKDEPVAGRWNFETDRFPNAGAWVPTDSVFVPRNVWRVEYSLRDPFSSNAHEVVYIDEELGVIFLKIAVSRVGAIQKLVFGIINGFEVFSEENDLVSKFPAVGSMAVVNASGERALISLTSFTACKAGVGDLMLEKFDPSALKLPEVPKVNRDGVTP